MLPLIDKSVVDFTTNRYRRNHNTAVADTEKKLNDLYGGYRTILCNSGMEAVNTVFDLIRPNTVIVDDETYFETRNFLRYRGQCHVIQIKDLGDREELSRALFAAPEPIIICGDNPTTFGRWYDVKAITEIAHRYSSRTYTMFDNSIASLYYSNPIIEGADICVESYTKYVCGYGDCFAGGIALNHSMEWLEDMRIPCPAPNTSPVNDVCARRGNRVSPETAYCVARGLETLPVRMDRCTRSAQQICATLCMAGVDARHSTAGGLITLPGMDENFCRKLKHFATVGTFGCTYSNADFFRTDSYYKAGKCARLSIGLENPDILIEDIEQALGIPLLDIYERMKRMNAWS